MSNQRAMKAPHGASAAVSFAAIFGEANPVTVTSTPRPVGFRPAKGEPTSSAPQAILYGWVGRQMQTKGMSVLSMDQINRMPDPGVQGITRSAINHSSYAPYNHFRSAHWMYARWDPIYRFANTALDLRASVGKPAPLSNAQPGNLPGSVRMGPYAAPYRNAWQVPRFSAEPYTIIPQAGK